MIRAAFGQDSQGMRSVEVSGHAGYAGAGEDIVCAAVTSALQMAVNAVTEVLGIPAQPLVEENRIRLELPANAGESARAFLQALCLHLELLEQDYKDYMQVTVYHL